MVSPILRCSRCFQIAISAPRTPSLWASVWLIWQITSRFVSNGQHLVIRSDRYPLVSGCSQPRLRHFLPRASMELAETILIFPSVRPSVRLAGRLSPKVDCELSFRAGESTLSPPLYGCRFSLITTTQTRSLNPTTQAPRQNRTRRDQELIKERLIRRLS
ncbi:hypothetical protein E2C01_046839 [Portunus trituberculatus]|uniref:Uncharacterized protein n=1 Tax=Portunus trituberculatus TaxID=210409 RepID=A0A5B7G792_PORTR|nr:hypothetical protein [Portunus trituberculatus]